MRIRTKTLTQVHTQTSISFRMSLTHSLQKALALAIVCICTATSGSTHWPQFRGPIGSADAGPQTIPLNFGPNENLLWKVDTPEGHSSPCIWGDHIFISGYRDGELLMQAYDRSAGTLLWSRSVENRNKVDFIHRSASYAQPTPCSDGQRVFFYFGTYGLIALDFQGKTLWEKRMSLPGGNFGTGASPIIVDESLILIRDNTDDPCVLSLDAATGETNWKHPRIGYKNSQSSPYLWSNNVRDEIIIPGSRSLVSLDPESGQLLWKVADTCALPCTTPIGNEEMLFFASWTAGHVGGRDKLEAHFEDDVGFTEEEIANPAAFFQRFDSNTDGYIVREELPRSRARDVFKWIDRDRDDRWTQEEYTILLRPAGRGRNVMVAIKAGGDDELNDTPFLAWERLKHLPYVASPLLSDDRVYLVKSLGIITCLDTTTGIPHFEAERTGVKGEYYASPVQCGDKILITSSLGTVIVIRDSSSFKILAKNDIGEEIFASPAIVNNTLYIRSAQSLWAFREN